MIASSNFARSSPPTVRVQTHALLSASSTYASCRGRRSCSSASGVRSTKSRCVSRSRAAWSTTARSAACTVSVVRAVPSTAAAASTRSRSRLMFVRLIVVSLILASIHLRSTSRYTSRDGQVRKRCARRGATGGHPRRLMLGLVNRTVGARRRTTPIAAVPRSHSPSGKKLASMRRVGRVR